MAERADPDERATNGEGQRARARRIHRRIERETPGEWGRTGIPIKLGLRLDVFTRAGGNVGRDLRIGRQLRISRRSCARRGTVVACDDAAEKERRRGQ